MYIQKNEKIVCSKCKSVNNYEDATQRNHFGGGSKVIRRCLNHNCKHEEVISNTTVSNLGNDTLSIYRANNNNERSF